MGYSDKMFEEALSDLREDNKELRKNLDKHVQIGAEFWQGGRSSISLNLSSTKFL